MTLDFNQNRTSRLICGDDLGLTSLGPFGFLIPVPISIPSDSVSVSQFSSVSVCLRLGSVRQILKVLIVKSAS